jgi:RimJ/RimL family protein N-acetyltransferase
MKVVFQDDAIGHWVCHRTGDEWHSGKGTTMAFLNDDGEIVCGIVFYDFNGRTVWMGIATNEGWASPEAFHAVADYAYKQLGVQWVRCRIAKTNFRSTRLVESVGFELETLLSDSCPSGDEVIYRLSRDNCKWLDLAQTHEAFAQRKKPSH